MTTGCYKLFYSCHMSIALIFGGDMAETDCWVPLLSIFKKGGLDCYMQNYFTHCVCNILQMFLRIAFEFGPTVTIRYIMVTDNAHCGYHPR